MDPKHIIQNFVEDTLIALEVTYKSKGLHETLIAFRKASEEDVDKDATRD